MGFNFDLGVLISQFWCFEFKSGWQIGGSNCERLGGSSGDRLGGSSENL